MEDALPFPIKMVFLWLVLPVAFVYLLSVTGIALLFLNRVLRRLVSRFRPTTPTRPSGH
jgi:hypothetical protein